jgi:hypothetical protein
MYNPKMHMSAKFLLESLSRDQLESCINENPSFRGFLQGYVAEEILRNMLTSTEGISNVEKIDDRSRKKGDFSFLYNDKEYTVEVKSLSSRKVTEDAMSGGHNGTVILKSTDKRDVGGGVNITNLLKGTFDILAICTLSVSGEWGFKFMLNDYIPRSNRRWDLLVTSFKINTENTPLLKDSILDVLKDIG